MPVIRVHTSKDFTVMSNTHFREKKMSLKSKGLLSLMLSLPEDWDYSINGLAALSSDGVSSVRTALKELEEFGYLRRESIRDENGKIVDWNYDIFEKPQCDFLHVANPHVANPHVDNRIQLNTNQSNTKDNKELKNNLEKFDLNHVPKSKKPNLYDQCFTEINLFTQNTDLREQLVSYLQVRIHIKDKPLSLSGWKGILKKLAKFSDRDKGAVIKQSIDNQWASFYEVKSNSKDKRPMYEREGIPHDGRYDNVDTTRSTQVF